ncbi:radical SAM protein [Desulfatiferula olefinivorans]
MSPRTPRADGSGFKVQWHLTERCNLSCRHCYQDALPPAEPDTADLFRTFDAIRRFFDFLSRQSPPPRRLHLSITGGEPLIRDDLFALLDHLKPHRHRFGLSILTNGTLIDGTVARALKRHAPDSVQISMDGPEAIHDHIRGPGSFRAARQGAAHLIRQGIPVVFAFTVHRENKNSLGRVLRLARSLGVRTVWADRLLPRGRAEGPDLRPLSAEELQDFHRTMARHRRSLWNRIYPRTTLAMHRALQFLEGGGRPYRCRAGSGLLAIGPDGTVWPCRRMPLSLGNIHASPLEDIYRRHDVLIGLRNRRAVPKGCENCVYLTLCQGGLRCLSFARFNDPLIRDPDCPGPFLQGVTHAEKP